MVERELAILNVEDDPLDTEYLGLCLREAGFRFRLERVETRTAYLAALQASPPDLILCDFNLPLFGGLEAMALAREQVPDVPFIFLSGTMGETLAVQCLQEGATDYVLKGDLARLGPAVRRALDLADRKRVQAEADRDLVHREKLALIGQLSAGLAHELNNPITFVNLNLETLVEYADTLEEGVRHCLKLCALGGRGDAAAALQAVKARLEDGKIRVAVADLPRLGRETLGGGRRVSEIVRRLRGFSRDDRNDLEEADLSECMEEALKLGGSEIRTKCEVRKSLADPGPRVRGRSGQLVQVFLNLIVNAAQAIPKSGRLEVEVAAVDGVAVARVRDDGGGIRPEVMDRLFTPFFTTKPPGTGTGMGLYVSHGIVKSHGGEIVAANAPGGGAEFTIRIPLASGST
jgi:signal transduction histidine kinase